MAHGADVAAHGLTELISGEPAQTFTSQAVSSTMEQFGYSKAEADFMGNFADASIGIAGSATALQMINEIRATKALQSIPKYKTVEAPATKKAPLPEKEASPLQKEMQESIEPLKQTGCFTKGTLIWTESGYIAIEKILVGTYVFAFDSVTNKIVKASVTKLYIRKVSRLIKLKYKEGIIYTTAEHPFYINNKWIEAGRLKIHDSLTLPLNRKKEIQDIAVIDTNVFVYNITVAGVHNYFITKAQVLVHNNGSCQFSKIPKAEELRNWAKTQGYKLLSKQNGIETWGIEGDDGWRLKIKEPSTTPGIDPGSQKWRYSARTKPGEYLDPTTGQTGTRSQLGHLDVDPN